MTNAMLSLCDRTEILVDGGWRRPAADGVAEVEDPATGEIIGTSAAAGVDDVDVLHAGLGQLETRHDLLADTIVPEVKGAAFNPAAPFGGDGRSGKGSELGRHGIEEFLETKSVQQ